MVVVLKNSNDDLINIQNQCENDFWYYKHHKTFKIS